LQCVTLLFAACAVGPRYSRPPLQTPSVYRDGGQGTTNSFAELAWWQVYQDRTLQALIREALTNNYDIRIAAARVEESRALAFQARSQFFPSVEYDGAVDHGKNDLFGSPYPNHGLTSGSAATSLNAFWEVDLWGRVRRLNESARAQYLASQEAQHGVRLSLLSDVATAYFQLLDLDQELQIADRTTNSFAQSLQIFQQRTQFGVTSDLDAERAEAALAQAASTIPQLLMEISQKENQLCVLLGRVPGPIAREPLSGMDHLPPQPPAGLPSALVERRPDLREAEQDLRSANADVGESIAEFFPKIGLTAFLGKVSPELSAYTLGGANAWAIGADASGPLFEGGRLVGQYRQTRAARDEAKLRYQQTVLTALREVSDALIARERLADVSEQQAIQVQALVQSVKLSLERYDAGKASYYEVLEAQQELFPAQLDLTRTQTSQLLAVVDLYKALGGGWDNLTNPIPPPQAN
jgi:multidrug efflux system outer membrane protein